MYKKYVKRFLDIICALFVLIFFWWLYVVLAIIVRAKLGAPVIFKQLRPGIKDRNGQEEIFTLYKFRTMTNATDSNNNSLSDAERLTVFGAKLRDWSLDELPEIWNILKGDMSFIGPRPQLVRDMMFMTPEQRKRHEVKPGLSGLAQISGRNGISWEEKLAKDLEYIKTINLVNDIKIFFATIGKVFIREGINTDGLATAEDYGDYLLRTGKITEEEYIRKMAEAKVLLQKEGLKKTNECE